MCILLLFHCTLKLVTWYAFLLHMSQITNQVLYPSFVYTITLICLGCWKEMHVHTLLCNTTSRDSGCNAMVYSLCTDLNLLDGLMHIHVDSEYFVCNISCMFTLCIFTTPSLSAYNPRLTNSIGRQWLIIILNLPLLHVHACTSFTAIYTCMWAYVL